MHPTATLDTTLISLRTQHVATLAKAVKRNRLRYEGIHVVQVDAVGAGLYELVLPVAQSDTQGASRRFQTLSPTSIELCCPSGCRRYRTGTPARTSPALYERPG
jgi:hypothetical protein